MGVFGVGLALAGLATQLQTDGPALPLVIAGATLAVLAVGLMRLTRGRVAAIDAQHAYAGGRKVPLADLESVKLTWWTDRTARTSRQGGQGRRDSGWLVALDGGALPSPLVVLDAADELTAWRTAEQLARQLDVPMIDDTGEAPAARAAAELDVPLADWLARQPDVPAPGDPPARLAVTDTPEAWRAEHPGAPWWIAIPLCAAFAAVALAISLGARAPAIVAALASVCALALALGFLVSLGALGRRAVELTADAVVVHAPFPHRSRSIPLTGLERIRLTDEAIHFVSDRAIACLALPGDAARYVRDAILHRLRRRAAPYR